MFGLPIMPATAAGDAPAAVGEHSATYSPITLSSYWPKVGRLLFVLFCSIFGSIMNGFFISSFCVNHGIRKIGNLFLACAGIADMIITAAVMPIVTVVLLSGEWETLYMCKLLQFLTQTSTYAFSLNFAFVGAENYFRVCRNPDAYKTFMSIGFETMAIICVLTSTTIAGAGVFMDLDYDYCKREHAGNYHFKLVTSMLFTILPAFIVYGFLIITIFVMRHRVRVEARYRRSRVYRRDCTMLASNLVAYTLYILAWIPYFVVVNRYPSSSDSTYYSTAWTGVLRSIVFGLSYGIIDRNYRYTYGHLFNYCCCKINLGNSFIRRQRIRTHPQLPAVGEVRVHIMHRALVSSAAQRGGPHRGAPYRGVPHRCAPHRGVPHRGVPQRGAPAVRETYVL